LSDTGTMELKGPAERRALFAMAKGSRFARGAGRQSARRTFAAQRVQILTESGILATSRKSRSYWLRIEMT
jgi:hypothetical protein